MDIKKSFPNIILAAFSLFGFVLALLAIINLLGAGSSDDTAGIGFLFSYIAVAVACLAFLVVSVLSILDKAEDVRAIILIAVGAVALILCVVAYFMISGSDTLEAKKGAIGVAKTLGKEAENGALFQVKNLVYQPILYGIGFGVLPLVNGLSKKFSK